MFFLSAKNQASVLLTLNEISRIIFICIWAKAERSFNNMLQETLLNAEGYKELQDELENLKTVGRKEAAEKIKVARSYGDLSENAEYDEAMSDQAKLEARISELENMLKNAKVFDESSLSKDVIHIGSQVVIVDTKKNEFSYKIVGYAQADPDNGKISDESPVGKALIGKKVGDEVQVEAPIGLLTFKVKAIS